jgi:hypothetical protein
MEILYLPGHENLIRPKKLWHAQRSDGIIKQDNSLRAQMEARLQNIAAWMFHFAAQYGV